MKALGIWLLLAWTGWCSLTHGEGIPGTVEWSDGRKSEGVLSLTPGKDIRLFEDKSQASLRLADIRTITLIPEKEEMREGFYFPEPGKAAQEKTGEIYPTRGLRAKIILLDGRVLEGHLYTTMLYVEKADDTTEKIPLLAKQTGKVGQKLADISYPALITLQSANQTSSLRLDLSKSGLKNIESLVVVSKPDLTILDARRDGQKTMSWSIPFGDPSRILFAAVCSDGIHVSWPDASNAEATQAVEASLSTMRDFYDVKKLVGCFFDAGKGDVYSLVLLSRTEKTHSFEKGKEPWTLVILRWKYDPEEKKTTLLNRVPITSGRTEATAQPPSVFKESALFSALSPVSANSPKEVSP